MIKRRTKGIVMDGEKIQKIRSENRKNGDKKELSEVNNLKDT